MGRRRHGSAWALAGLLPALLAVPAGLALVTGSLSIPHNDAWSHSLIAQHFARTGRLELVGWNRPALVGQVVLFGPLGASVLAQQVGVLLLGALGLAAGYGWLAPRVGPRRALFGVAVLAAVPEFGLLATSFMTDVPAFAGLAGCLWLGDRAARRGSQGLLVAAVAAGGWAATVREQAIAAPLAVLLVALVRGRDRRLTAGLLAVLLGGFALLEQWRRALPGDDPPQPRFSWPPVATGLAGGLLVLGLYLLPALLLVARPARWPARAWVAAGVVAVPAAGFVCWSRDPLLQNTLSRRGAYASASLGLREVLPLGVWGLILLAAVLGAALLAGQLAAGGVRLRGTAALFSWLTAAGLLLQLAAGQGLFSRYLLPLLLPLLAGLLARPARRAAAVDPARAVPAPRAELPELVVAGPARVALLPAPGTAPDVLPGAVPAGRRPVLALRPRRTWPRARPGNVVAAGAGLTGMLALSWTLTASTLAYDAARWRAAQDLVDRGVPARDIEAGLEWVGTHAGTVARRGAVNPDAVTWYARMFPGVRACYLVSAGGRPAGEVVAEPEFARYAVAGRERLWVVRTGWCDR